MKFSASKDNSTATENPASREVSIVAMGSFASPHVPTKWPASPVKANCIKNKDSVEDCKVWKATTKQTTKTNKLTRPLHEAVDGPARSQVNMSVGCMVMGCSNSAASLGTSTLISMYSAKGNVSGMSQMHGNLPLSPISADIPK